MHAHAHTRAHTPLCVIIHGNFLKCYVLYHRTHTLEIKRPIV